MENTIERKIPSKGNFRNSFVEKSGSNFSFPKSLIHKGDIFLVDFKTNTGCEQNGLRPALILQNDIGNNASPTTIVCPISTRRKIYNRTHIKLLPEECGIQKESVLLCEQIRVIDKSRIGKKVGQIRTSVKMMDIERKVKILLGFESDNF